MKNEEFIELRNKFLLGVLVALIVTVPFLLFFVNRYVANKSKVIDAYNEKKTFTVLVYKSSDCSKCSMIREKLDDEDIYYLEYDLDKENTKDTAYSRFGFSESKLKVPALIYVKDGVSVVSSLDIKDSKAVEEFIKYSKAF